MFQTARRHSRLSVRPFQDFNTPLKGGGTYSFHVVIYGSHCLVIAPGEPLGEVVCKVHISRRPHYSKLALVDSVLDPVESHIKMLASVLFYSSIHDSFSSAIVCTDGYCFLWVSKFLQRGNEWDCFLCVHTQSSAFCFSCR